MRSYGELFRQGDTIGVTLDMDIGMCIIIFLNFL
jgi:hypothetical protein